MYLIGAFLLVIRIEKLLKRDMQNSTASSFHFFSDSEDQRLISWIGFEGIQAPSVHYMESSSVEFNIKFCRGGNIFLSPILLFGVSNNQIDIRQPMTHEPSFWPSGFPPVGAH